MTPLTPPNSNELPSSPAPANPETLASEAKSLLASKTFLGVMVALLPAVLRLTGVELPDTDVHGLAADLVSILGSAIAIYGRVAARQPIRLTPPKSESVDILLLLIALGAVLWFTGCAGSGANAGGTRWVESVSVKGGATREESTGETSGTAEVTVRFRDARDSKTIRPLEGRPVDGVAKPDAGTRSAGVFFDTGADRALSVVL